MARFNKAGEKSVPLRFAVMLLIFLGLIAVTFALLRPLEARVRRGITGLRDGFIEQVTGLTGLEIEYGTANPSVFGSLDINNIRLIRPDSSVFLSISRLRLFFSIWDLLRGKIDLGFRSIGIDRPVFSLDLEKDTGLLSFLTSGQSAGVPGQNNGFPVPQDFQIRIRSGEINIQNEIYSFAVRNFNLEGNILDDRLDFNTRCNVTGIVNSMRFASANTKVSGELNLKNMEGNATLNIPSVTGDTFRLQPLSFSFLLKDSRLEIQKIYDRLPLDLAAVWDSGAGSFSVTFQGNNFSPADLAALTGSLKNYNTWMTARLSGRANLTASGNGVDYSAEFNGTYDRLGASMEISAAGNSREAVFKRLHLAASMGTADFTGTIGFAPLAPKGVLTFTGVNLAGADTGNAPGKNVFNGQLEITSSGQEIDIYGSRINCGSLDLSGLAANITREENGLTFQCRAGGSGVLTSGDISAGDIIIDGSMDYNPGRVQASLRLDSFPVQGILDLADPFVNILTVPDWLRNTAENVLVSTEIFFTTDYEHILYNAPALEIEYDGSQKIYAEASLSGTDQRFELDRGHVDYNDGSAGLTGFADFSDSSNISFTVSASVQNINYMISGVILDMASISIRGSYGLEAFFSSASSGGYSGYFQGENIPIPIKDQNAYLSFMFSLRYDTPSFWSAGIDRFDLVNIPTQGSPAAIRFTGSADQDGAIIPGIYFENDPGLLSGTADINWDPGYSQFSLVAGIGNPDGSEQYRLSVGYKKDGGLELDMSADGMILDRVNQNLVNGTATGSLHLSWESLNSFRAELSVPSYSFQAADRMLRGSVSAVLDQSELILSNVRLFYGSGLEADMPYFNFNRELGSARTSADAHGSIGGMAVDCSLNGSAEFKPVASWLNLSEIFDSFRGVISADNVRYNNQTQQEPFMFTFASVRDVNGLNVSVDGGPRNMVRLRWSPVQSGGGNLYAALTAPFPIRGSFTGFLDSRTIDISTQDLYADMGSLWKLIPPNEYIAFPGGIVAGSVRITGSLRDPEFYGSAKATSLKIQVPGYLPQDIRPIPVTITMEGNEMRFGPVYSAVGDGYGNVTGVFGFERWIPLTFRLDIQVPQDYPIPVALNLNGVHANGKTSGNLILAMQDNIFDVYGDLVISNTEITLNAAEIAAAREIPQEHTGPVSTMVNLMITSGRQVEFFWPSVEFPILQAYADMGSGIRVVSDVVAKRFSLTGDIKLRSGEIFYLERNFYLREGTLFFNENESRFEPRITARAEIRDQSDDGPVTISMVIDNAPLHEFTPRFESNPPLSQFQILSLMGQNQTGNPATTANGTNVLLAYTADALTQFTVMRTLQREIRNFLGLDMFSVRTRLLQNFLFQATGLQSGGIFSSGTGNYFDNTTVFLGKYLGPDIFLESMFSWRYDPAKTDMGGLKLEPEIGLEMRNPLFDVKLNMLLLHPENWFINDITFSLAWRWSF
ncbi:MAG: translocation/assembly module TamB domain-containing protein [Treponema sp.]|nr:translocation/assembly module TamB domain-containing protein [Treponema sp.]